MTRPFRTGDRITANEDPRHVARVDALLWGAGTQRLIRVTWIDTGWRSDLHLRDDQVEHADD